MTSSRAKLSVGIGRVLHDCWLCPSNWLAEDLTAAQEVHVVTPDTATGSAALALTDSGLAFFVTVEGLSGSIAAAHFHNAPAGVDGGVVRTISGDFTGNTAAGFWTSTDSEPLTDALIAELVAGNLYLNVHTAANGGGEIRGQVRLSSGMGFEAGLTAAQEVHVVTPDTATGTASLTLTDAGLAFKVTVEGLSGPITGAHFHNAAAGTDGSVVRPITGDFAGNTASGLWTSADTEPLTAALITELLAGNLYLNVHTAANGAGEIRGQVIVTIPEVLSTEEGDFNNRLPEAFSLSQNFPNPFNPATTLRFGLPAATDVTIVVYDLLGQEVIRLINRRLEPGYHQVVWHGRDESGADVSTGLYMGRITTPAYTKSIKMLLLK